MMQEIIERKFVFCKKCKQIHAIDCMIPKDAAEKSMCGCYQ